MKVKRFDWTTVLGWFFAVAGGLVALVAVVALVELVSKSVEERADIPPEISLQSFLEKRGQALAGDVAGEEIQSALVRIVTAFDGFAEVTNQSAVNRKGFGEFLAKNTQGLSQEHYTKLLVGLAGEAEALREQASRFAGLSANDPAHIKWNTFAGWYITQAMHKHAEAQRNLAADGHGRWAKANPSEQLLINAAVLSLLLIMFALVALLFSLERNGRRTAETLQRLQDDCTKVESNTRATVLALRLKECETAK